MKIDDNDVCDKGEVIHRRETFDKEFTIGLTSECEYDEDFSEMKKKVVVIVITKRVISYEKVCWWLLFYYMR